jgi:hypothetical protein
MQKTYNIFLDDERFLKDAFYLSGNDKYLELDWVIVRNYKEFVDLFVSKYSEKQIPNLISFDHDLSFEHYGIGAESGFKEFDYSKIIEKTGMDCAKWLVEFCMDKNITLPEFLVHSQNTCGRNNINGLLNNFKKFQEKNEQ